MKGTPEMSDTKNIFEKISANQPKRTSARPVMDERGRTDLPPGTKGGEKMKSDLHEIHKQHTFDSFCKKVLKHEANNGHREINRRALMDTYERSARRCDGATCGVR